MSEQTHEQSPKLEKLKDREEVKKKKAAVEKKKEKTLKIEDVAAQDMTAGT